MQNAGIAQLGLNWRYLALEVEPAALRAALTGAQHLGFIGVNLTVPHKVLALPMMEQLDASAKQWGAVNTVRIEGRDPGGDWKPVWAFEGVPKETRLHGFNTDADGLTRALAEELGFQASGRRVLLLGAGGAGRTAALKMALEGAKEIYIVNRTQAKVEAVAEEIHRQYPATRVTAGYPAGAVDLLLNATSLGLKATDALPWEERAFPLARAGAVYDMIYRPAETPLLRAAKAAGCRAANGLGMLLHQGARALEIWTGQAAPAKTMRRALEINVYG